MSCLHACPSCARHVRSTETACPFCDAALPGECELPHAAQVGRISSRAAIVFAATAAITACGKSHKPIEEQPRIDQPQAVTVYGPPPMLVDASVPVPLVTDAGKDAAR